MRTRGIVAVATTIVFWSAGNLIVRDSPLTGPQIAFWRYLIAGVGYAILHRRLIGPLTWRDARRSLPTALAITIEIVVFFIALKETTVANATVIGALMPLLLFGVAARRFSERIPAGVVAATLLALLGVAAVVFGADAATWNPRGDLLAVLALGLFAAYFALAKAAREQVSSFTLQTHTLLLGTPLLLGLTIVDSGGLHVPVGAEWMHVFGLILFPTTGHLLINWAHAHVSLTLTSMMTLGVPVLSTLGAAVFFDESLGPVQLAGVALVLTILSSAILETGRLRRVESEAMPVSTG